MDITIRPEKPGDALAVRNVYLRAFDTPAEADLVDALRKRDAGVLALVALEHSLVVGHILFTNATVTSETDSTEVICLAPLGVQPTFQNQGIGKRLVQKGLALLADAGHEIVTVLGHPNYYPQFGFIRSSAFHIYWRDGIPEEALMVTELQDGALKNVSGKLTFCPEIEALDM
ncbi:MAG: N-acetyltransferase [Verrucomicrobia bacterium]|nr:N-acetyltransferase [Verrucomicrobiota bacterium]